MRRELDSLVTQMHSSGMRYDDAVREFKKQYLREVLVEVRAGLKRPPRSERPVYSAVRQSFRQG